MPNCCFCGPARNCGKYIEDVLKNIDVLGKLFDDYEIIVFYDRSEDDTLVKLRQYRAINTRLKFYVNRAHMSRYRTHRIATARNFCLEYVRNQEEPFDFFVMMDFDDPNVGKPDPSILNKYIRRTDWDALSFNTTPRYYDIWALSIFPFCFSYNHFNYTRTNNYQSIQSYIIQKLNMLPPGQLLHCISAFNGFAIYRTDKFRGATYDGTIRFDLIPRKYIEYHSAVANSPIVFRDFGHINGLYEDCEHRAFHVDAVKKNGARIMIAPDVLFGGSNQRGALISGGL